MRLLVAALLLAALWAPCASAASVSVVEETTVDPRNGDVPLTSVAVVAGTGEANRLTIVTLGSETADAGVEVRDTVPLTAGTGCAPLPDGAVRCIPDPAGVFVHVDVEAGDGDDEVDGSRVRQLFFAKGGPGDDRLVGASDDDLAGEAGDDVLMGGGKLDGGAGSDRLLGGAGPNVLVPDGPGTDVASDFVDGGGGPDEVSYAGRTVPVDVDLADAGPDGAAGERDELRSIEDVVGGEARDRLLGDDGSNRLAGSAAGSRNLVGDRLDGRGGNDSVVGGAGDDVLRGGAGDDTLAGQGGRDLFDAGAGDDSLLSLNRSGVTRHPVALAPSACGAGFDSLFGPPGGKALPRDCEKLHLAEFQITILRVDRRNRTMRLSVHGGDDSTSQPCGVRLAGGSRRRTLETKDGRSHPVTLAYRAGARDRVRLRLEIARTCGRYRLERTLVLRLPR